MIIDHDKFDCYFGIRPTSNMLHLGHSMTLFNMFDIILANKEKINTIYFLMAELHAEISTIDTQTINNNALKIEGQVNTLMNAYFKVNNVSREDTIRLYKKVKFVYQGSYSNYHIGLTYKYLPLLNSKKLLKNPIFKNGTNSSVAFLTYPVLQTFDILLYTEPEIPMYVFVGNDQRANVNILRDISKKLKLKDLDIFADVIIYDNVLYDNKAVDKMSKSLNNFVRFNDINGIKKYIMGFVNYPRKSAHAAGIHEDCPFYNRFGKEIFRLFPNTPIDFDVCDTGEISCKECKQQILDIFINICSYCGVPIEYFDDIRSPYIFTDQHYIKKRYVRLLNQINNVRSNK